MCIDDEGTWWQEYDNDWDDDWDDDVDYFPQGVDDDDEETDLRLDPA